MNHPVCAFFTSDRKPGENVRSVFAPGWREHCNSGLESVVCVPVVQPRGAQHARGRQVFGKVHRVPGVPDVSPVQDTFDRIQPGRGDSRVHRQES